MVTVIFARVKAVGLALLIVSGVGLSTQVWAQQPADKEVVKTAVDTTARPTRKKVPISTTPPPTAGSRGGSRIVDDSTQNVYGPKTTRWTTERDWFQGRPLYRPLDTAVTNFHRWTSYHRLNYFYQDLGNNGTALNPIFPAMPVETIGVSPGFTAYGDYYRSQEPVFFDTKSPYSRMNLVWGGEGRAATRIEFSRNINPRWNFGFNYRPILTDKQIQKRGKADRHAISHYYDVYSVFKSKDSLYSNLVTYRRIRHRVIENGGAIPPVDARLGNPDTLKFEQAYPLYFQGNVRPTLTAANSIEQRNEAHMVQQLHLSPALEVYHVADLSRQINWYKDDLAAEQEAEDFYDNREVDSTKVLDSTRFKYLQNQIGVKGRLGKGRELFYQAFYRIKSYNLFYKYLNVDTLALSRHSDEHYVGGALQYDFDSLQYVRGDVQLLRGGYSRWQAEGRTRWLDFRIDRAVSKPTFLQTAYRGNFDRWSNEFKPVQSLQGSAFAKATVGPLFVSVGATYTAFDNYIYFLKRDTFPGTNQRVLPVQTAKQVRMVTPEFRADFRFFRHLHLRPQLLTTRILSDADSALAVPKFFVNTQLAFENTLFKKNLLVQIGVDLHWHSDYQAMGYDPAIQTFYVQRDITSPSFLQADLFFNGKMKRGRFFIKYHNLLQAFTSLSDGVRVKGHMPTPFYPGQRNILDFGFDILLFD